MNSINYHNLRGIYHSIKNLKELDGKTLHYVIEIMESILSEYENICIECNGSGWIEYTHYPNNDDTTEDIKIDCYFCDGSGKPNKTK